MSEQSEHSEQKQSEKEHSEDPRREKILHRRNTLSRFRDDIMENVANDIEENERLKIRVELKDIPHFVADAIISRWEEFIEEDGIHWGPCALCAYAVCCSECPLPILTFRGFPLCNGEADFSAIHPSCYLYEYLELSDEPEDRAIDWKTAARRMIKLIQAAQKKD